VTPACLVFLAEDWINVVLLPTANSAKTREGHDAHDDDDDDELLSINHVFTGEFL
jgi:hypothetical protein